MPDLGIDYEAELGHTWFANYFRKIGENEGKAEGEARGKAEGKAEGEARTKLHFRRTIEHLHARGKIPDDTFSYLKKELFP